MTRSATGAWLGRRDMAADAAAARWRGLRYLLVSAVTAFLACLVLLSLGAVLLSSLILVGVFALPEALLLQRRFASMERRRAAAVLGTAMPERYVTPRHDELTWARLRRLCTDPTTWRDLAWLAVHAVIWLVVAFLLVSLATMIHPLWVLAPLALIVWQAPWLAWAHAALARLLLKPSPKAALAARVEELATTRAEALAAHGAELGRIERDLHDGAQARMVSVGLRLGIAEQKLGTDPEAAARLVREARDGANEALTELRDVVRGIHPPILSDRGLDGAIHAVTAHCPVPVTVEIADVQRLPAAVEAAAYFVITEGLTNVARHSGAAHGHVRIAGDDETVLVEVLDDGCGGGDESRGSGLTGIRRRVAAFDGYTEVSSPRGGPTVLRVEMPCGW